jgi:hypothetical protein
VKLPINERSWFYLWWGAFGLFLAVTYLLAPIADPDFFWHLNTGQWIWEHKGLPPADPFGVSLDVPDIRQRFILTSSWFAQLGYYCIYSLTGWTGFFVARYFLVFILIIALLARKKDACLVPAMFIACFLVSFTALFPYERPQYLSFIAFAFLIVLLDRLIVDGEDRIDPRVAWGLPALMLFWSNVHGGVLLGQVVCLAYLANNIWHFFAKDISSRVLLRSSAVIGLGLLFSFINPNALDTFTILVEQFSGKYPTLSETNYEYQPWHTMVIDREQYLFLFFPILVVLAAFEIIRNMLRTGVRKNLLYLLLLGGCTFMAFKHIRYLSILGIVATPFAANAMTAFNKKVAIVLLIALLCACVFLSRNHLQNIERLAKGGPIANTFPVKAAEFINQNGLRGNVFHEYRWGGYLGWALGPGNQIFDDGRTLNIEKYFYWGLVYSYLNEVEEGGGNASQAKLDGIISRTIDKYRIDYMILPIFKPDGTRFILTTTMARRPGWRQIYGDATAVVFVRNPQLGR